MEDNICNSSLAEIEIETEEPSVAGVEQLNENKRSNNNGDRGQHLRDEMPEDVRARGKGDAARTRE